MSTPEQNVSIVQAVYAAFGAGDMDGILAHLDEQVKWCVPDMPHVPYAGCRFGRDGVREFFALLSTSQTNVDFGLERLLADAEKVCALGHYTWDVVATGKRFTLEWVHLFTIGNGRVIEFKEMFDPRPLIEAHRSGATQL
jgi:ketosteroid isomerase-like protein